MNQEDILSGKAGVAGIQRVLNGQSSRRLLRSEAQTMLRPGYRAGPFHLTRAKFKPGRKLSAYFTFPALDAVGQASHSVHLAVTWQKDLDGTNHADGWDQLQEEASQSGLMPVQRELWRDILDQGIKLQVWPFDPKFPHLVRLGNPSYVAGMFASLGIAHDLKQLPVITPIRYRPGERHVLRYEIDSPETVPGRGTTVVRQALFKRGGCCPGIRGSQPGRRLAGCQSAWASGEPARSHEPGGWRYYLSSCSWNSALSSAPPLPALACSSTANDWRGAGYPAQWA